MTQSNLEFFASTIRGAETLLREELLSFGATDLQEERGGIAFQGTMETAYRACLWSRVASRILLKVGKTFAAPTPQALYGGIRHIHWPEHIPLKGTFAVDFTSVRSQITHTHFGALKTKDAIADQFTSIKGSRPSVAVLRPDVRVHVHLFEDQATPYIDLSGESLHRRSYRSDRGAQASLKETLADTILLLAGWQTMLKSGAPSDTIAFLDPLCGSGTLPIEAALIALNVPPGFKRTYYGFNGWLLHDPKKWDALLGEAGLTAGKHGTRPDTSTTARKNPADQARILIRASDSDPEAIKTAKENARLAGVQDFVHFECKPLDRVTPPSMAKRGLFVANPPYGERLSPDEGATLLELYQAIGDTLKRRFKGWDAAIFTGNREIGKHIGLKPSAKIPLFNGPIECRLFRFQVY